MSGRRKRLARALKSTSPRQVARRAAKRLAREERVRQFLKAMEHLDEVLKSWDRFLGWCRTGQKGSFQWYI